MIEINLLPKELQKKKIELPLLPLLPIGMGILVVLLVLSFVLLAMVGHYQSRVKKLTRQLEQKEPLRNEALKLEQEVKRIKSKKQIINQLTRRKFFWAEKLNLISDLIPMGVWLTHISFDERGGTGFINLHGIAVPYKNQEIISLVTLFMENLKQDDTFYKDFKGIELGPIRRVKIDDMEAMQFNLTAEFKKEKQNE